MRWPQMPEGQFFERKSAFDRSGGTVKRLKAPAVARQIADTLSAMASADLWRPYATRCMGRCRIDH